MSQPTDITILDVGHGNCCTLIAAGNAVIIDAPPGTTLLEHLVSLGVRTVDRVIISHSDKDHIGGVIGVLLERRFSVKEVYLNPDAEKGTDTWKDLVVALEDARTRGDLRFFTQLTVETRLPTVGPDVAMEVLGPTPGMAAFGSGNADTKGRPLKTNSMSAVIRVFRKSVPVVLLPGDVDAVGLENLLEENKEIRAAVLVFPHHGGKPGSAEATAFADRLCSAVQPQTVLFSIGRGIHKTPQPEIVAGVKNAVPKARIMCTQLSERCAATPPKNAPSHLANLAARGRPMNHCCGGSIPVGESDVEEKVTQGHATFVDKETVTPLCR